MDEQILAWARGELAEAERLEVAAALARDPAAAARAARLTRVSRSLQSLATESLPAPRGLATAALAAVAAEWVARPSALPHPSSVPAEPRALALARRALSGVGVRAELVVLAAAAFLAVGLGVGAIGKVREQSRVQACRGELRRLHAALESYADAHAGGYPRVGTAEFPVAASVFAELVREGHADAPFRCPAAWEQDGGPPAAWSGGYAYTLGYRPAAGPLVVGVRRAGPDAASDATPLAADRCAPPPHGRGQNVLFASGTVRFATTPTVGVDGDDIYRNDASQVRAGLRRDDTALGQNGDVP